MKILYDYQIFREQKVGGISRYFFELMNNFDKDQSVDFELQILYSDNEYLKNHYLFKQMILPFADQVTQPNFRGKVNSIGNRLFNKIKNKLLTSQVVVNEQNEIKAESVKKIKEGNFDIFHPTYYDDYFMPYIGNKPFVLTIYDLIHQIFPDNLMYLPDKSKEMIQRADRIISISENTKKDLINIFGIDENKVDVTYLANSLQAEFDHVSDEFKQKIPKDYLLYVGSRFGYKNFLFFSRMFSSLKSKYKNLNIVTTGSTFDSTEQYWLNKLGIQNCVYNTFVSDNELSYLYKNAIAFVFPSMYEGFGLPVLEAFSCGCPAIISSSSSLSEIGGNAVVYFEPKNPESMLQALKSVIDDPDLRKEKILLGYKQLENFSWDKTAIQTKQIYEKVLLNIQK